MRMAVDNCVPEELFDLYGKVLESIDWKPGSIKAAVQRTLSWIYYACRTLKMSELLEAIVIRKGDTELDSDDLMEPDYVVEVCEGLMIRDKESGVVSFCHEKV